MPEPLRWSVAGARGLTALLIASPGCIDDAGDDGSSVACGAVGRMDAPQWLSGAPQPTAVFGDGEALRVYLCGEDGENRDLLTPHGMRGLPLGFEPPLGH